MTDVVAAADVVSLDDGVGGRRPEPQWPGIVPDLALPPPVDHGPLVQSETTQLHGAPGRCLEHRRDEPYDVTALPQESRDVQADARTSLPS